jgi:hypothetical protein
MKDILWPNNRLHSDRRYRAAIISFRWAKLCIFNQAPGSRRRQVKRSVMIIEDEMPKYLFIDTNIYLDFYRIRNEVKTSFLDHLEGIKDSLIVTDQVEMEFKKNRQIAILEGMKELRAPSTDIVKKLKKRSFFWTIYKGDSPTSILSHFLVGVCAPREVNFRQSSS